MELSPHVLGACKKFEMKGRKIDVRYAMPPTFKIDATCPLCGSVDIGIVEESNYGNFKLIC